MKKRNWPDALLIIFFLVFIGLGLQQLLYFQNREQEHEALKELVIQVPKYDGKEADFEDGPFDRVIDWAALSLINSDIVGWIYVPGTEIDYPVFMGEEYLKRDIYKENSVMGSIFIDEGVDLNTDSHLIVYGHNMRTGQMFGTLKNFLSSDYAAYHQKAYLYTPKSTKELELCSVFTCEKTDPVFELDPATNPLQQMSSPEFNQYLAKRNTVATIQKEDVLQEEEMSQEGTVLSLSTCYGRRGSSKRTTVHFSVMREKYVL